MGTLTTLDLVRPATDLDGMAGATALAEIDAAIALVAGSGARRVQLVAVPFIESVAAVGLARARAAGVHFAFERGDRAGVATVTVGPLELATAER